VAISTHALLAQRDDFRHRKFSVRLIIYCSSVTVPAIHGKRTTEALAGGDMSETRRHAAFITDIT
jgi:hypothetical protein